MPIVPADAIYAALRGAGFAPDEATTMTAIALAESHGSAAPGEDARGLWQINTQPSAAPGPAPDLDAQARALFEASQGGQDISPWTVTHGSGGSRDAALQAARDAARAYGDEVPTDAPPSHRPPGRPGPAALVAGAALLVAVGVAGWLLLDDGLGAGGAGDDVAAVASAAPAPSSPAVDAALPAPGEPSAPVASDAAVAEDPVPSPGVPVDEPQPGGQPEPPDGATEPPGQPEPPGPLEPPGPPEETGPAGTDPPGPPAVAAPVVRGVRAVPAPGAVCAAAVVATVEGEATGVVASWTAGSADGSVALRAGPRGWAGTVTGLPPDVRVEVVVVATGPGGTGELAAAPLPAC